MLGFVVVYFCDASFDFECCVLQLSLDSVWTVIFGVPASRPVVVLAREQVDLCPDAAMVIMAMIRSMLNQVRA